MEQENKEQEDFFGLPTDKLIKVDPKDYMNLLKTATKNIRTLLKILQPNIKFYIKSSTFSNGDSISISWDEIEGLELPVPDEKILNMIKYAFRDGFYDSQAEDYQSRNASLNCYGSAKYVKYQKRFLSEEEKIKVTKTYLDKLLKNVKVSPVEVKKNRL